MKRKSVAKSVKNKKSKPMNEHIVIDLNSPIDNNNNNNDDGTPLRAVFCLKRKSNMEEIEKKEDCFILDFDPCDDTVISKGLDDDEVSVISEKGQTPLVLHESDKVACRDYPHPRHLCVNNQFDKTPHDRYCELCYCFVCDMAAPCKFWTANHCHAINNEVWSSVRRTMRTVKN